MSDAHGKPYRPWSPEHYRQEAHSPEAKLPADDLVSFLLDTVPDLDLSRVYAPYEAETRGAPPFDPQMMVCLLLYADCVGVFSSRKIARSVRAQPGVHRYCGRGSAGFSHHSVIFARCIWQAFCDVLCAGAAYRGRGGAGEAGQCVDRWHQTPGERVAAQSHELWRYAEGSRAVARGDRGVGARRRTNRTPKTMRPWESAW